MPVTAIINGPLRDITEQRAVHTCVATTLDALITVLDTRFPGFCAATAPRDELGRFINVYVDGTNVRSTGELQTALGTDSVVRFDLSVSGG